ncbi:MAG: hypothetical protein JSU83_18550 [Deltaproteobacteria bacterium]|nr:MAG: hypothetical protein JSU83_18550 [Deltaproteobacteria bacterium]
MNNSKQYKKIIRRIRGLNAERRQILSLPPQKALERILDAPRPAELVHSFPEEDLYLLIQDIGPQDCLPILSLASDKQWEYILDMDAWHRDRLDIKSLTVWLDLLYRADAKRCIKWLVDHKTDLLEFYLFKNIEVKLREHDQDPSEFGDDFFSHDNVFYVRLLDYPFTENHDEGEAADIKKEQFKESLTKLIDGLAASDHITYQKILLESATVIPAESEEEAYRLRNIRLAEKGFLPFEEAVGIYQPLSPEDLKIQGVKSYQIKSEPTMIVPVPEYSTRMLEEDSLFVRALRRVTLIQDLEHLQVEFASLCNQIITADQRSIRDRVELEKIVKKACGYISIGLQSLTDGSERSQKNIENLCAAVMQHYTLANIFRVGYGRALALKWRAEKWLADSWFAEQGLSLTFWGEEWLGVLGGILLKKPLFFDNYKSGTIYREFFSSDDVKETENILSDIMAFDDLLSLMNIELKSPSSYGFLTFKNLVLTLWSRHVSGLSEDPRPLTLKQFKRFYNKLWEPKGKPHKIPAVMKESFLDWLSHKTALGIYEISERYGSVFENLFGEIENEYGEVSTDDLDPRFVHLFLLEKAY